LIHINIFEKSPPDETNANFHPVVRRSFAATRTRDE